MRFGSIGVAARGALLGSLLLAGAAFAQYYPTPPPPQPPAAPPPGYYPPPPGYPPPQPVYQPTYSPPPQPSRGEIEIGGFVGYQASTNAGTAYGTIVIDGSIDFGGFIDYHIRPGVAIELLYIYVPTHAQFQAYSLAGPFPNSNQVSLSENWIQIGGHYSRKLGRLEPFGAITAGMVILSPGNITFTNGATASSSTQVRFAFTAGLGFKVWLTEQLGLRFEARALVPVYFTGSSIWVGTGGTGIAVGGGIPWAQFDFTGGVEVKF